MAGFAAPAEELHLPAMLRISFKRLELAAERADFVACGE